MKLQSVRLDGPEAGSYMLRLFFKEPSKHYDFIIIGTMTPEDIAEKLRELADKLNSSQDPAGTCSSCGTVVMIDEEECVGCGKVNPNFKKETTS